MTIRNLQYLFCPRSVAVIGASSKPHSVGATVLRNLLEAGFAGAILSVNPKYDALHIRERVQGRILYRHWLIELRAGALDQG